MVCGVCGKVPPADPAESTSTATPFFDQNGIQSPRSPDIPIHTLEVHNAHRIEMRGDSMRKNRGKENPWLRHRVHYGVLIDWSDP